MCNTDCPVYDVPSSQYSVEKFLNMLLDPNESKVCCQRPTGITGSATFVIDLDKPAHLDDAKKDNFGKWRHSGSHTFAFRSWFSNEGAIEIERVDKDYCLRCSVPALDSLISFRFCV